MLEEKFGDDLLDAATRFLSKDLIINFIQHLGLSIT